MTDSVKARLKMDKLSETIRDRRDAFIEELVIPAVAKDPTVVFRYVVFAVNEGLYSKKTQLNQIAYTFLRKAYEVRDEKYKALTLSDWRYKAGWSMHSVTCKKQIVRDRFSGDLRLRHLTVV